MLRQKILDYVVAAGVSYMNRPRCWVTAIQETGTGTLDTCRTTWQLNISCSLP